MSRSGRTVELDVAGVDRSVVVRRRVRGLQGTTHCVSKGWRAFSTCDCDRDAVNIYDQRLRSEPSIQNVPTDNGR